jgi:flagellar biosynthesis component FlhA
MIQLFKNVMKSAAIYALLTLVSFFLALVSEPLAYSFFFLASVLFSGTIVYETWKVSKSLKDIKYPTRNEVPNQKELQLTASIEKAIFDKSPTPHIVYRLRQILVKKMSLRLGINLAEAEMLLKNPEKLGELGYDRLAALITEGSSLPRTSSERIKTLSSIINQLEATD